MSGLDSRYASMQSEDGSARLNSWCCGFGPLLSALLGLPPARGDLEARLVASVGMSMSVSKVWTRLTIMPLPPRSSSASSSLQQRTPYRAPVLLTAPGVGPSDVQLMDDIGRAEHHALLPKVSRGWAVLRVGLGGLPSLLSNRLFILRSRQRLPRPVL